MKEWEGQRKGRKKERVEKGEEGKEGGGSDLGKEGKWRDEGVI